MGRRFAPLGLDEVERAELTSLASRRSTAQALALLARIILACAEGEQSKVVATRLAIDPDTVSKWRRRFTEHRLEGLWDEPRSGTPRTIEDARIEAVTPRGWSRRSSVLQAAFLDRAIQTRLQENFRSRARRA